MYLDYFSLNRHPFRITPDPELFFAGGTRGRGVVLDALVYGITSGEGILKVVGEVGSGKTMLCRMLEERLPKSIEIVYLANPSLSARDIVYAIAIELKLAVDAATDRLLVMHKLQEYLLRKHAEGGSVVVFIEEAQSMPLETLEEVRLLSNLETHRHKLLQIVLFGQPELDRLLEQKSIRQLRERITHSFQLAPLGSDEVRAYLHFRLRAAGCPWPQLFSPKAELMLAKASGGLSRRINILADKALLAAYADPATRPDARNSAGERLPVVYPRHVRTAITDSSYRALGASPWLRWTSYLAAALAGAFVLGLALWVMEPSVTGVPAPESPAVAADATVVQVGGVVARSDDMPEGTVAASGALQSQSGQDAAEPQPSEHAETAVAGSQLAEAQAVAALTETGSSSDPVPAAEVATQTSTEEPEPEQGLMAQTEPSAPAEGEALPDDEPVVLAAGEQPERMAAVPPGLQTLARDRFIASATWLQALASKAGYSVQLYSVASDNNNRLEGFLEVLDSSGLLESSYLCLISGNTRRQEQWLVFHGEFAGLSEARTFIGELPQTVRQHDPYARNMNDIACANQH